MSNLEKKIMIKTRILIVLLALIVSGFSFASVYANAVSFEMSASKTTVKPGDKVTIIAKTKDIDQLNGGFNGYSGALTYASNTLTRNESKSAVSGWTLAYNAANNSFVGSDPTGMDFKTSDLDVLIFEFRVLESAPKGKTTIKLSDLKLSDKNYTAINAGNASIDLMIEDNQKPVEPEKSSNNKLSDLKPSDGKLSPKFDPNNKNYTVNVDENTNSISFDASTQDPGAKVISGGGTHKLNPGKNVIEIVVEAEDGSKTTYEVIVNKEEKKDKPDKPDDGSDKGDNDGGSDKGDNGGSGDGTGGSNDGTGGSSDGTGGSSGSSGTNNNTNSLDNNSSNNYVINVEGFGTIQEGFDPNSNTHTSYVGRETKYLEPVVTLEDPNATYEIRGADNLKIGDNLVELVVTAANGDERIYEFNVVRTKEENTATLASLSVGGMAINPGFRPDVNYYSLVVSNDTNALGVSAAPAHGGAVVNISGNDRLTTGVNLIKITVDSNYQQNTYMVEVIKEPEAQKANYLPWIISAFAVIIAIALMIVLHYKNKMIMMKEEKNNYDPMMMYMLSQNNNNQRYDNGSNYRKGDNNE